MSQIYKNMVSIGLTMPSATAVKGMATLKSNFRFAFGDAVPVEHLAAISKASILNSIIINIGHKELT